METRAFGSATVPVLGIGTWKMETDDRAPAIAAIRRAVGEALQGLRDR